MEMVRELEGYAPLIGVYGNNDDGEVRMRFAERVDVEIEGHRVTLIHGDRGGGTAVLAARAVRDAEVVLFGHSHRPHLERIGERLLLNPGSPTDKRWSPQRSFAVLEVGDEVRPELVALD
jgi:putative phosphoesterase